MRRVWLGDSQWAWLRGGPTASHMIDIIQIYTWSMCQYGPGYWTSSGLGCIGINGHGWVTFSVGIVRSGRGWVILSLGGPRLHVKASHGYLWVWHKMQGGVCVQTGHTILACCQAHKLVLPQRSKEGHLQSEGTAYQGALELKLMLTPLQFQYIHQ